MSPVHYIDPDPFPQPSSTVPFKVYAASSSEAASLHGQKAKTPIIAGSICGSVMGLAWLIGLFIYIRKRYRRKIRKRAAEAEGKEPPALKSKNVEPGEKIIIPPDPAVILGHGRPGEYISPDSDRKQRSCPPSPRPRLHESEPVIPTGNAFATSNPDDAGMPGSFPLATSKSFPEEPRPH
ncbi:hypothetical protein E1B28_000709 [Marasmius oreades]|uniref:Uncharacterized protein n=1 Tax=Marasmius oreades TaxID=181124 RepID=A0A9P8AEN6_9AGAR|nr:uncharacterized protein E1B28_000709 [Marasmius oreades]KAG7098804.1 hypothetical protein E1B28_000709 [Marasmius oreades]